MIAISEHLRNHGFDPDLYQHTRIPHIWHKLRTYYNLEVIDERENFDDDESEDKYMEFSLPREQFLETMMQRAIADPSEAPTSPPQLELSPEPSSPSRKRRRGEKARGTSVDDTEDGTDTHSPAPKTTRGSRSRKKAAGKAEKSEKSEKMEKAEKAEKTEKAETTEEEDEEGEESGSGEEEEESDEGGTPASRSTRGAAKGRVTRARGRAGRRRR